MEKIGLQAGGGAGTAQASNQKPTCYSGSGSSGTSYSGGSGGRRCKSVTSQEDRFQLEMQSLIGGARRKC